MNTQDSAQHEHETSPGVAKHSYRSPVVGTDFYGILRWRSAVSQEVHGWKARPDIEPWPILEPIDWHADPFGDLNWYAQFHGWRHMDAYLTTYKETGDGCVLRRIVPWMVSWPAYRNVVSAERLRMLGEASGMRAQRLAITLDAYMKGDLDLSEDERTVLVDLARRDAEWLTTPGNIAPSNHAYSHIFGLELLSRVLSREPWAADPLAVAKESFEALMPRQFTDEGVHIENSPFYHQYALNHIQRSGAVERLASSQTGEMLTRAKMVLPWLVFPDGRYADVGDSTGSGQPLARLVEDPVWVAGQPYAVAPFWRSGYGIIRSLPGVPPEEASMLFVVATSHSYVHGHADKLSFELFEFGQRIIVDSGKYGYIRDPMRTYVQSAAAHNTVGLASDLIGRFAVTLGSTKLVQPAIDDDAFVLRGSIDWIPNRHANFAFRHQRELRYRPREALSIKDTLSSEMSRQFASRLHFHRSLTLERCGRVLSTEVNGHRMVVELLDEDCEMRVYRGTDDPIRGWQSVGYLQMEPTTMVEAIGVGQERTITWQITFD